jgi:hypothetical protein
VKHVRMQEMKAEPRKNAPKPISLAPLSFEVALAAALQVKPEPKREAKPAKKSTTKKTSPKR